MERHPCRESAVWRKVQKSRCAGVGGLYFLLVVENITVLVLGQRFCMGDIAYGMAWPGRCEGKAVKLGYALPPAGGVGSIPALRLWQD